MDLAVKPLLTQCGCRHCRGLSAADNGDDIVVHNASSEIQSGGNVTNPANAQTGVGIDHHAAQRAVIAP
ncbi:hypothetical protein D3C73_1445460 [compost metagenome]